MNKQMLEEMKKKLDARAAKAEKASAKESGGYWEYVVIPELQEPGLHEGIFKDIKVTEYADARHFNITFEKDGKDYLLKAKLSNKAVSTTFMNSMRDLMIQLELKEFQIDPEPMLKLTSDDIAQIKSCAGKGKEITVVISKNFVEHTAKTYYNPSFNLDICQEAAAQQDAEKELERLAKAPIQDLDKDTKFVSATR